MLGVLGIQLGNGVLGTAVGLHIDRVGLDAGSIALVMSGLYAGQVACSFLAPRHIARTGHVPAYVGLVLLAVISPALFFVSETPVIWFLARIGFGFGLAGVFIVVESWLNDRAANAVRGRVFAFYIVVQLAGLMIAQFMVPPVAANMTLAMSLVAVFCLLAIPPVVMSRIPRPHRLPFARASFRMLIKASPVGVTGAVVSGFLWAVIMAMAPIYAQRSGFSPDGVAVFVAAAVAGGLILQWPLGWLSDHRDRRAVLMLAAFGACLVSVLGATYGGLSLWASLLAMMGAGGLTFPFYALSAAHVNDAIAPEHRVPVSGALILLFGIGSVGGPFAASRAMETLGPQGFFMLIALATGLLGLFALAGIMRGKGVSQAHTSSAQETPHP